MIISRDLESASGRTYDVIVVGGGVYGVMLGLEASLRGLSVFLAEKDDFGGKTSFNSLKTLHGGLRYLQTLNLTRYYELVGERRWFLKHFPDLVEPLPVLMPLYREGLRRPAALRAAFLLDRLLSRHRNDVLPEDRSLPPGHVVAVSDVERRFDGVRTGGLQGGALWYDACMPDTQRIIIELLRSACDLGAGAANYLTATDLLREGQQVVGIRAVDGLTGTEYEFHGGVVINATGPWTRTMGRRFDRDIPHLFHYSVAWNVLFDREALSDAALAVAPPTKNGRVYFLHPWKGRILAGTGHAARGDVSGLSEPTSTELDTFIFNVNAAVPRLRLTRRDVLHVYPGVVPVTRAGSLDFSTKDVVVDHGKHGGPVGLYSITGTKFTAARSGAGRVLARIFPDRRVMSTHVARFEEMRRERSSLAAAAPSRDLDGWFQESRRRSLQQLIEEEAVWHLDDLVLRRTTLGDDPDRCLAVCQRLCTLFDWDGERCRDEIRRVRNHFKYIERSTRPVAAPDSRRVSHSDL